MLEQEKQQLRDWANIHAPLGHIQARLTLLLLDEDKRLMVVNNSLSRKYTDLIARHAEKKP